MLLEFGYFIVAFWREWKSLLTGGTIIALLAVWNYMSGKTAPKAINWSILGITLVLSFFFAWRKQWIEADRDFVQRTPIELANMLIDLTDVHSETITRPYKGKRIKITGTVRNVCKESFMSMVFLECDGANVAIRLPLWTVNPFIPIPKGTVISVVGRIEKVSVLGIMIGNAELVPPPLQN